MDGGRVRASLGALAEGDFRFLFGATVVSSLGDAIALIALAFAVLDVSSASGLGLVVGARQAASAGVLVLGGVLSDRMPRNRVLVGASLLRGSRRPRRPRPCCRGRRRWGCSWCSPCCGGSATG